MVLRKSMPHPSIPTVDDNENEGKKVKVVQRKSISSENHWDFLDEIEAPRWADFTLEFESGYRENDDEWFHMSHPFHEYSSRQLISMFSHSGEGCTVVDFGVEGPPSPKLPASVSRSRGKHYKSMEWGQGNCKITSDKQHPIKKLSDKSSLRNHESATKRNKSLSGNLKGKHFNNREWGRGNCKITTYKQHPVKKLNDKSSLRSHESATIRNISPSGNSKGCVVLEAVSLHKNSLSGSADENNSKVLSLVGNVRLHHNSIVSQGSKSNSTSVNTCESGELVRQKISERPSLLSALKVSIRKSCVMRQASRIRMERNGGRQSGGCQSSSCKSSIGKGCVIIKQASRVDRNGGRHSDAHKSSSSNSSVGSSSNPGYDGNHLKINVREVYKEKTPDNRNVRKIRGAPNYKVKVSSSSNREANALKSTKHQNTKTMVRSQDVHAKVLVSYNVNKKYSSIAAPRCQGYGKGGLYSQNLNGGKLNAMRAINADQKFPTPKKVIVGKPLAQRVKKTSVLLESGRTKPIGVKGKVNNRGEGLKSGSEVPKIYFR